MATVSKTYRDVTIVITYDDDRTIDAEIVDSDNDNSECYLPDTDYYIRIYRSSRDIAVSAKVNFGTIELVTPQVAENITEEYITFNNVDSVNSNKIIYDNFQYSSIGLVYDEDHNKISSVLSFTEGQQNIRSKVAIMGIFEISYYSEYMKFKFRSPRIGKMLLSFVGS